MSFLTRSFLEEIEDAAFDLLVAFEEELVAQMIDEKGTAYGDVVLSRSERIMKFLDDEERGVNEQLKLQSPDEYESRVRQFERDVRTRGL